MDEVVSIFFECLLFPGSPLVQVNVLVLFRNHSFVDHRPSVAWFYIRDTEAVSDVYLNHQYYVN